MKLQTHRVRLFEILLLTLLGVLMYVSQVIMSPLPNIEIVSLLVIVITCVFGAKSLVSVYIFVICEIFTYGIEIWIINYLYVWTILCVVILFFRKTESKIVFSLVSGIFGLLFGTICSVPYFAIGGIAGGIAYIIKGIPYDILHCIGNLVLCYLLFNPFLTVLEKAVKKYC